MKSIIFKFTLVIFMSSSFLSHAQEKDELFEKFTHSFIEALKSGSLDSFVTLKPDVSVWRKVFPDETKELSDQQIYDMAVLNDKLKGDFQNIINSAKENKVDLRKIKFKKITTSESDPGMKYAEAHELVFTIDGKEYLIAFSSLFYEGRYYLSEILISYDIFRKFK